jgi:hypothetical protein
VNPVLQWGYFVFIYFIFVLVIVLIINPTARIPYRWPGRNMMELYCAVNAVFDGTNILTIKYIIGIYNRNA